MGCLQSKTEPTDLHPNSFRVVNIDENGADLCPGQLEITECDIVLYREGRDTTIWPLHSLRRYGFEGDIFSFESGRRCETGEGIYAFRCRRASFLFSTLQQQIQLRNVLHDAVNYPVSRMPSSPQGRQTLQASVIHRSSIDNGHIDSSRHVIYNNIPNLTHSSFARNVDNTPRSPSSVDILEVMPLYPRPQSTSNQVTNVYQVGELKREHNNNQSESATAPDAGHVYCNDFNRDLAMLRNTLREAAALNTMKDIEDENLFLESRYMTKNVQNNNQTNTPLSPTLSNSSEHYAQLSLEQQEPVRLYVNIPPNEADGPAIVVPEVIKKETTAPTTPLTPKPNIDYSNFAAGSSKPEVITYANLTLGEVGDCVKNVKPLSIFSISEPNQKFSESDTFTSLSPVEEMEVNYAILDIDSNPEYTVKAPRSVMSPESHSFNSSKNESTASCSSQARARLVSQCSTEKGTGEVPAANAIGYTTIDFDKTVALTSVASDNDAELDASRRTRHNSSSFVCGVP